MNFSKEIVENKILPHLFFNSKGDRLFDSAKKYFEQSGANINTIIHEFDDVDLDDEIFWENIVDILSIVYDDEINKQSLMKLLNTDADKFFEKLLSLRFGYEFVSDDEVILVDIDSFDDFVAKNLKLDDNFIIEDGEVKLNYRCKPSILKIVEEIRTKNVKGPMLFRFPHLIKKQIWEIN